MNIKQAKAMLDQIKTSGLENRTKVAQDLVSELEAYIKSASMNKKADLTSYTGEPLKQLFVYWATASLQVLQKQGEASLEGMVIPSPENSEQPLAFGARVLRSLPSSSSPLAKSRGEGSPRSRFERKRMQNRQASPARYAKYVSDLFEENKSVLKSGIGKAKSTFKKVHKKYEGRKPGIVEDTWLTASIWASSHKKDAVMKMEEGRATQDRSYAWNRIQANTKKSASVSKSVMEAIHLGVFNGMTSEAKFFTHSEKAELGLLRDKNNQAIRTRHDGLTSGEGDEEHTTPALAQHLLESDANKSDMSDEEMEIVKSLLLADEGPMKDPEIKILAIKKLLLNGDLKKDDSYFTGLYHEFIEGKHDGEFKEQFRAILLETGHLTLSYSEGLKMLEAYNAGEYDDDLLLKEDMAYDLINDGWLESNIEVSVEAETAADMIVQKAEERSEVVVDSMELPGEGDLQETLSESVTLDLQIAHIKKLSKMFADDQFHWMLDANLYLEDTEWAKALRESSPSALKLLNETIEEHQEPLIALGLRYVFNSQLFKDKAKLEAMKAFADDCLSDKVFKANKAPLAWFIELAVQLNGGLTVKAGGENVTLTTDVKFFNLNQGFYNQLKSALNVMSPAEIKALVVAIEGILKDIKPNDVSYPVKDWLDNVIKNNAGQAMKSSRSSGIADLKEFYSKIASELVRYRFFLDLGYTEASGDLVPKTLGKSECDTRVRSLIGPIPTSSINEVKNVYYETVILKNWKAQVETALNARVELKYKKLSEINNRVKAMFSEFGIEPGTPLYEAFTDFS